MTPDGGTRALVFVLGTHYSGASLLAWALAQHSRIDHLPPQRFNQDLRAVLGLALPPTGTPMVGSFSEGLEAVPELTAKLPEARFIHVLRDIGSVIASAASPERPLPAFDEERLCRDWLVTTRLLLDLEVDLGATRVRRILGESLIEDPAAVVSGCLGFIGEAFEPACLRPFTTVEAPALTPSEGTPSRGAAEALYRTIGAQSLGM